MSTSVIDAAKHVYKNFIVEEGVGRYNMDTMAPYPGNDVDQMVREVTHFDVLSMDAMHDALSLFSDYDDDDDVAVGIGTIEGEIYRYPLMHWLQSHVVEYDDYMESFEPDYKVGLEEMLSGAHRQWKQGIAQQTLEGLRDLLEFSSTNDGADDE